MKEEDKILNLIDADSICWALSSNLKDEQDIEICKQQVDSFVNLILSRTNSHYYLGFLGGNGNFRKELSVDYKAKRPDRPDWFIRWEPIIKHILVTDWKFVIVNNIESEDAVSICHNYFKSKYNLIASFIDKDLNYIEGNKYNYFEHTFWYSDRLGSIELNSKRSKIKGGGLKYFYAQLLTGDKQTDGVEGLPKKGAVFAYNLLVDCTTEYQMLFRVYRAFLRYSTKEHFILTWKLIRMLDFPAYDFQIPEVVKYEKKEFNIEDLI